MPHIRQKQAAGIAAAKKKGKRLECPALAFPANWNEVFASWKNGKIAAAKAMEFTNTKRTSFYKLASLTEEQ